jgi:hypothetical protein
MLTECYTRITFPQPISETDIKRVGLILNACADRNVTITEAEDCFECSVYETEEGHTIEVDLDSDLTEEQCEQIVECLSEMYEDFVLECT